MKALKKCFGNKNYFMKIKECFDYQFKRNVSHLLIVKK